ncbi:hypothetical protein Aspvir_008448 [Aspergillus viridinutans]|uniref:Uncharacterized protein n=1 Tax=Aspergillus viridinutans TaxID=75553 RepID=A0A9P3C2B9_ASPVI|nr:uncharacterized protein Aspvir_008448 [Aspergillus viridinutans]GIK04367.1 hypothetical protein Aspvir_008448 [Aspergillus viridinutans]
MSGPKRVILRLSESDLNPDDVYEPVRLYLEKHGHSSDELATERHFIHVQPPNPHILQNDPKIHIVIDLEKDQFSGPLDSNFPHDLHRIRRKDDKLEIYAYREGAWLENFKRQIRHFTDGCYPWGMTTMDSRKRDAS